MSKDIDLFHLSPKNVIIRRDVKFAENISAYEPSSADVPPLSISSTFENISSSDDESEDENPPPPSQDPPSAPQLPKWVCATRDAAGDPTDQPRTHSEFDRASYLLAQDSGHPDLVPLPKGQKLIRCNWVYRTKFGPDGKVDKIKLILLLRVFHKLKALTILKPSPLFPK